jgi:hypothetical protein
MPDLNESLRRIAKATEGLEAQPAAGQQATPTKKSFKPEEFDAYVAEQMAKGTKDPADVAKARVAALHKAMTDATAAWGANAAAVEVDVFVEPAVAETPIEKTMRVFKSLHVAISKGGALHKPLAKSTEGKALIQKAGSPTAVLERIATMFGYDLATLEAKGDSLSWKVESAIHALQQAAKLEKVLNNFADVAKADTEEDEDPLVPVGKSGVKKSAWGAGGDLSAERAQRNKSANTNAAVQD